ncbi:MAG: YraN family protein [Lentisphaeria bacterium]|nr:YraN family protein [Lentisphaeria bacterium]
MLINAAGRKAHLKLGKFGEDTAVKLLKIKGYRILARNFRLKSGELDIVALDGLTVVFVEVKTLRRLPGFRPAGNLSLQQMRRNHTTGKLYLALFGITEVRHRYDLIEITVSRQKPGKLLNVTHTLDLFHTL